MGTLPSRCAHERLLLLVGLLAATAELLHRRDGAPLEQAAWLIGDCASYRDVTRALLRHQSVDYRLVNPRDADWYTPGRGQDGLGPGHVSLAADGRLVPLRSILLPLALVVPYALLREVGLLVFNIGQCLLLLLLVYWLARRYSDHRAALFAALAFLATSALRPFTFNVSPDVFGAVLMLGGVLLAWRDGRRAWIAGGLLMGLACWLRPVNGVVLAALVPAAIRAVREPHGRGRLLWPLAGFFVGVSGQLVLNTLWFGRPWITSYDRWLAMRDGQRVIVSVRDRYTRPFWASLVPTLILHKVSFLQTAPYWPLFVPAVLRLGRERAAESVSLFMLAFVPVLWLVKYEYWDATLFGNRFMLFPAAVTALGLSWICERLLLHANGA